jgi:signal transduction histidine kinase
MTFRRRLLVAFLAAVLLPMMALGFLVRGEMTDRLAAQYERRVESLVRVIEEDLAGESERVARSLAVLRDALVDDNRFRRGAVDGAEEERVYLLDYAEGAMRAAGLSMLQIQDAAGRIVSSGHFRNDYDRMEPDLPGLLASAPGGAALVRARSPEGPFVAFATSDSFRVGNRRFTIVGGSMVDERFLGRLVRDRDMTATLDYPGGALFSADTLRSGDGATGRNGGRRIVRELSVPFIDAERGQIERASFLVAHDMAGLVALKKSVDRWILFAVVAALIVAVGVSAWLASRMSRPLAELADKTSRIDLDRLDVDFVSARKDEIGILSRGLGAMTERLRASAVLTKEAERRATLGELARQVNHDIKNGLTPIRNVFRHLSELARDRPDELPRVFQERKDTVDSSVSYLETLATHYARLSSRGESRPCDVNEIVRRVIADRTYSASAALRAELGEGAIVRADPLSLRRLLENLTDNAIDSLEGRGGSVTIETGVVTGEDGGRRVRIVVSDTGVGMNEAEAAKIFNDFYTTKPHGTGLGLSIVRRLVMDLDGSIRVESEKGRGSRFVVELPGEGAA